jgi:hypothetical protein
MKKIELSIKKLRLKIWILKQEYKRVFYKLIFRMFGL